MTYSDAAEVKLALTAMDAAGKAAAGSGVADAESGWTDQSVAGEWLESRSFWDKD